MRHIQSDFTTICKWSHDSGLVLNGDKTKFIHVHSSHVPNPHINELKIVAHSHDCLHNAHYIHCDSNCRNIEQVNDFTYLGLVIDNRFKWNKHIDKVCNKLRAIMAKFYIVKSRVPYDVLVTMYKALVESTISYGLSSYGRTYKTYLDRIYNLQYRLLKQIVPNKIKDKFRNNELGLFHYCGILPIHRKVELILLQEQYFLNDNLVPKRGNMRTRGISKELLSLPRYNNIYGKRTTQYLVSDLINKLPSDIKGKLTSRNIKFVLKKYFMKVLLRDLEHPV